MKAKTAVIYGDSISTRNYGNGGYEQYIKHELGLDVIHNHAISASALTDGTPNNLIRLLDDESMLHPDADLVVLWHGTNDWYWGAPVGNPMSGDLENESTYVGALNHAVRKIRAAAPQAKILCLTPLWRLQAPDGCETVAEAWINSNKIGATLRDYCHTLQEMSQLLCFPVLDMRSLTNFNEFNHPVYQPDMVHPSDAGYRVIADILCGFIKTYIFPEN